MDMEIKSGNQMVCLDLCDSQTVFVHINNGTSVSLSTDNHDSDRHNTTTLLSHIRGNESKHM